MSSPISAQSNSRAGLCPHGLPPSACPICSGGAMGGAKMKDSPVSKPKAHSNEWSYMKCYAVGLAMKAQQTRAENAKSSFERQIEFAKQMHKNIENLAQKIQNVLQNIQNISPKFIIKTAQVIANVLINTLSILPKIIEKFALLQQDIKTFIMNAGEKLVSVLGEIKNFIDNKFIKSLKKRVKKLMLFFFHGIEDENYKNDENLAIFKYREIKKYLIKIIPAIKERKDNAIKHTESHTTKQ